MIATLNQVLADHHPLPGPSLAIRQPPSTDITPIEPSVWHLGLDIGTTGLSAVLRDQVSGQAYPIVWQETSETGTIEHYRLPVAVYLDAPGSETEKTLPQLHLVTPTALAEHIQQTLTALNTGAIESGLLLHHFKPYLKAGIPHYQPQIESWEPTVQWSDQQPLALIHLQQGLRSLLATLRSPRSPLPQQPPLICHAMGLQPGQLQQALDQLVGVMVNYPANWPDTYSFNLREAILAAGLVQHPAQICLIEDPIAAVLSGLRGVETALPVLPGVSPVPQVAGLGWRGDTLIISAGALNTELGFVTIPDQPHDLTHTDFQLRTFAYAGLFLDQDIVCQLLYPQIAERLGDRPLPAPGQLPAAYLHGEPGSLWTALDLRDLAIPAPSDPDPSTRYRLQQRLETSILGRSLLAAAQHLKLILQHQERFDLQLGDEHWIVLRHQLESRIFVPYIQRLNRELNTLIARTGANVQGIRQVICTGGTASLPAIARWLRQKIPNATIIQDTYAGPITPCSRIAYGLATLPAYPQVLDLPRQQYSDYFLLLELLRTFPDQALPVGSIMKLLERRGINIQTCHLHILALLEGHLPPGLIPGTREAWLLHPDCQTNPDYRALMAEPLFYREGQQIYRPNPSQHQRLERYLSQVLARTRQKLEEPYAISLTARS